MFVRMKIGNRAEQIVEMEHADALGAFASGSAASVTDDEIREAGFQPGASVSEVPPEQLLAGYVIERNSGGPGFDLLDPGGVRLNPEAEPYQNYLVAHEAAMAHSRQAHGLPPREDPGQLAPGAGTVPKGSAKFHDGGPDYEAMTVSDLDKAAAARSIDFGSATAKGDKIAVMRRADRVDAAIAAGDYDVLTRPELELLAEARKVNVSRARTKQDLVDALKK